MLYDFRARTKSKRCALNHRFMFSLSLRLFYFYLSVTSFSVYLKSCFVCYCTQSELDYFLDHQPAVILVIEYF